MSPISCNDVLKSIFVWYAMIVPPLYFIIVVILYIKKEFSAINLQITPRKLNYCDTYAISSKIYLDNNQCNKYCHPASMYQKLIICCISNITPSSALLPS